MIKDKKLFAVCFFTGLSGIAVFYLIPFISVIIDAFTVSADNNLKIFGAGNFIKLFKNGVFWTAMKNTGVFTVIVVLSVNLSAFIIAGMIKYFVDNTFILSVIILPLSVPTIVTAAIFGDRIITDLTRIINIFAASFADTVRGEYAFLLTVLIYLWKYTGFHALIYIMALSTVPPEQYDAASLDGASVYKKFRYIILPCITPFIWFSVLLSVMNSFKIFKDIYILFGDYPPPDVYLLQHFIQNNFIKLNLGYVFCSVCIFLGILIAIFTPLIIKGNITEKYYDE